MPRKHQEAPATGRTILLVDDSADYLEATRRVLAAEGHRVLTAPGGTEALALLRAEEVDLVLLDYHMPGMTGEEMVRQLREFNTHVQVILQTGYASEVLPRNMLKNLDIQGYFDKSEGTDKLLLWTEVGLKAAQTLQQVLKSRQGLRHILGATPELHRLQPLGDLLQGILLQVSGLLGAGDSFLAFQSGFLAMANPEMELEVHAGVGRFKPAERLGAVLPPDRAADLNQAFQQGVPVLKTHETILPLRVGENTLGILYLDRGGLSAEDYDLLTVFTNQAAVAIRNSQLYAMATQDPLSMVYVRRFYDHWMLKELKTAYRQNRPLSLVLFDLDHMKEINDTWGHPSGDKAIAQVGALLLKATRATDFAARFGGDEFAVILPDTDQAGARTVGVKILDLLHNNPLLVRGQTLPLAASLGTATLMPRDPGAPAAPPALPPGYFEAAAAEILQKADDSLYRSKNHGRNQVTAGDGFPWPGR